MQFEKYQGLGNDFVLVEQDRVNVAREAEWAEVVRRACDRSLGIGADGVLSVESLVGEGAARRFEMRIWNADGSQAAMCGNGLRCVGAYLVRQGHLDPGDSVEVLVDGQATHVVAHGPELFEAVLAGPSIAPHPKRVGTWTGTFVGLGNPHFVIEMEQGDPQALACAEGPSLGAAPDFPEGVNVGFVRRRAQGEGLDLAVWERGSGMTGACGSGACAAVLALGGKRREVFQPGGVLEVWLEDEKVHMKGQASFVFAGSWDAGS